MNLTDKIAMVLIKCDLTKMYVCYFQNYQLWKLPQNSMGHRLNGSTDSVIAQLFYGIIGAYWCRYT